MKEILMKTPQNEYAAGEVFLLSQDREPSPVLNRGLSFGDAVEALKKELAGKEDKIYEAAGIFLEDKVFLGKVEKLMEEGKDAQAALSEVCGSLAAELESSDNEYLRGRSDDVIGLGERLKAIISGNDIKPERPCILVSHMLSPAQLSAVDPGLILGIVTERGTATSHVSALAGSMGVPYLFGCENIISQMSNGDRVIIDGERLKLDPDDKEYEDAVSKLHKRISAPADGMLIPMEDIPDEAFSSGSLGQCVGILPDNGDIYAPCNGRVSSVAETKHAMTITRADGSEILVHAGIDTVKLKGKGFNVLVSEGDQVKRDQKIMEVDIELIKKEGYSPMVIIVNCK